MHKLDESGNEIWKYPAHILHRTDFYIRLEAHFDRDVVQVGPLVLHRGDKFIETYYFNRWYNIFEVFDGEGAFFKGWYCNITRPAVMEEQELYAEDLALDLVVMPDGTQEVLDEQEFEGIELSADDRVQALRALHTLQTQVIEKTGIFSAPPTNS